MIKERLEFVIVYVSFAMVRKEPRSFSGTKGNRDRMSDWIKENHEKEKDLRNRDKNAVRAAFS